MSLNDLLILLRLDLRQSYRVTSAKGSRSTQKSTLRRMLPIILVVIVAIAIIWFITAIAPPFWTDIVSVVQNDPGFGATIFNAILVFGLIGSLMISATTVGNSDKMEYIMVMPLSLTTIFLEKMIVIILYSSMLWLVIGVPIFIGLSIISPISTAFLSVPVFMLSLLVLTCIGVSFGGLLGLLGARLVAGRRILKQIGYAVFTSIAILASSLWYLSIYLGSDNGGFIFDFFFQIASYLGLSSNITPGYVVSAVSLNLVIGATINLEYIIVLIVMAVAAVVLLYGNAKVSERAHYSGWLAAGSKRSSTEKIKIEHESWNPNPIPWLKMNSTITVSIWYNIANVKREARVFTQYLLGPLRFAIFLVIPLFTGIGDFGFLAPLFVIALMIPFSTSYGVYFAGYETVYEGKNLMNLQLAGANMVDYIKGKAISAVPFSVVAAAVVSVIFMLLTAPYNWLYVPLIIIAGAVTTLATGSIAANAASTGGDFKASRLFIRQRGSSVQMPIRGWAILRAQIFPNILAYVGIFSILVIGMTLGFMVSYFGLLIYVLICIALYRSNAGSAGRNLMKIEATDYL